MKFLSNILTIALIALFTLSASATSYSFSNVDTNKDKKETIDRNVKDTDDNKDNKDDKDKELSVNNLELTSEIVSKAKPTQLELPNTSILLDLNIKDDKIELSPKLN